MPDMQMRPPPFILFGYQIDITQPNVFRRLTCAGDGCSKPASMVWHYGEGKLSEKQLCGVHYVAEWNKALIDVARERRLEEIKKT